MRDRLIDVINSALKEQFDFVSLDKAVKVADELLAKGVIVPPCKVGDEVYLLGINKIIKCIVYDYEIVKKVDEHERNIPGVFDFIMYAYYMSAENDKIRLTLSCGNLGKTWFLDETEAKKAQISKSKHKNKKITTKKN